MEIESEEMKGNLALLSSDGFQQFPLFNVKGLSNLRVIVQYKNGDIGSLAWYNKRMGNYWLGKTRKCWLSRGKSVRDLDGGRGGLTNTKRTTEFV
jgi:hypothetical protein